MRYGVCTSIDNAALIHDLGFDYVEAHAGSIAAMTEEEFSAFLADNAAAPVHAEAANCLFPGDIRLTGEAVDWERVTAYVNHTLDRLGRAGISLVVFGSGGCRTIPEGFPREEGWQQMIRVCRILGEAAARNGITVGLEPLCYAETNAVNTQQEGFRLVQETNHPNVKLLCDYYHMLENGGKPEDVAIGGEVLSHIHMAAPYTRRAMTPDDGVDYEAFFRTLEEIGYNGRISFEGKSEDFAKDLPGVLEVMRRK